MTAISAQYSGNAVALRLLQHSSGNSKPGGSQDQADAIIKIVHDAESNALFVDALGDNMEIDTTDGDETDDANVSIQTYNHASIRTGGGDDAIGTYDYANVNSGSGDDTVGTYRWSTVNSGDGNDRVTTYGYGTVDAGAGDDFVYGYTHMSVNGGDGNDEIRTSGYSTIDSGAGDDVVVTLGYSTVSGGDGNDTLIAVDRTADHLLDQRGHATIDGGAGDDYIQIGENSTARGGVGEDTILLMREGSTVIFAAGDGHDKIMAEHDFTVSISDYGSDDVSLSQDGDQIIVSFGNSKDSLTLTLREGRTATLEFANGGSLRIEGANENTTLKYKFSAPEWFGGQAYLEFDYSAGERELGYGNTDRERGGR